MHTAAYATVTGREAAAGGSGRPRAGAKLIIGCPDIFSADCLSSQGSKDSHLKMNIQSDFQVEKK